MLSLMSLLRPISVDEDVDGPQLMQVNVGQPLIEVSDPGPRRLSQITLAFGVEQALVADEEIQELGFKLKSMHLYSS